MNLKSIDNMPSNKEKLFAWMAYAKKYNCLNEMPEIHDLYRRLRKEGKVTLQDWNERV